MSCDYYDLALGIPWKDSAAAWVDAHGVRKGDAAFATQAFDHARTRIAIDVTTALAASAQHVPGTLVLRSGDSEGGTRLFASREGAAGTRPRLTTTTRDGKTAAWFPVADSTIDCTTSSALGAEPRLRVGPKHAAVLRFDVPAATIAAIQSARLDLVALKTYAPGVVAVYALAMPVDRAEPASQRGLAAERNDDRGLEDSPDVMFVERFESPQWFTSWSMLDLRSRVALTSEREGNGFRPLHGRALRVTLAKGVNLALDLRKRLRTESSPEPVEAYFRYYLRLGDDWGSEIESGKLPGLSGTYGRAGWGGRNPDGRNGWNMRMTFSAKPPPGHPARDFIAVGTEAVVPPQRTGASVGVPVNVTNSAPHWPWMRGFLGVLERNRWYSIEQHVRLNSKDSADGVFEGWIDGQLAIARDNVDYRYDDRLRIEEAWLNVYHGGTAPAASEQHLYIDNVVIARRYIGPTQ